MAKKKARPHVRSVAAFAVLPPAWVKITDPVPLGSVPGGGDTDVSFICRSAAGSAFRATVYDAADGSEVSSVSPATSCPQGVATVTLPSTAGRYVVRVSIVDPGSDEVLAADETLIDT